MILIIELKFNAKFFLNSTLDRITVIANCATFKRNMIGCFGSDVQLNGMVTLIERVIAIFNVRYRIIMVQLLLLGGWLQFLCLGWGILLLKGGRVLLDCCWIVCCCCVFGLCRFFIHLEKTVFFGCVGRYVLLLWGAMLRYLAQCSWQWKTHSSGLTRPILWRFETDGGRSSSLWSVLCICRCLHLW